MDIHTSKLELVRLIIDIENQVIINKLIKALRPGEEDFWLELSAQEKEEIELGIKQLDEGQRVSFDDFLNKV